MNLVRALVLASLASVPVLACAQEVEDDSFARRDQFVADFCSIVVDCCDKALGTAVTPEQCRENVLAFDTAAIEDEQSRTDCIAQLRAAVTKYQSNFCANYGRADIPACPDVRRVANKGKSKPGEPCSRAEDCAPSHEGPVQCSNGGCQLLRRGKAGDKPCGITDEGTFEASTGIVPGPTVFVCNVQEDNLYCDPNTNTCTELKAVGAECEESEECVRTAYCNESSKKCQTKKASESACEDSSECQTPFHCEEGFCRHDVDDGEDCTDDAMCKSNSCQDGKCGPSAPKDARLEPVCKAKS